ncbi:MAG: hypothetical protein WCK27_26480 [Verrucomicrobiota bacterium]|nr:hypothetical protein [Verrucomicrobiota bacterium]
MSTNELVAEKVKGLPEFQVQAVLTFIQELSSAPVLCATELMRLPAAERRRILASQARQAEAIYRLNPEMIVEKRAW